MAFEASVGSRQSAAKIAVIGNMNNAGFCIMRYLRDLGYDAHLILYSNDGVGPHAHFSLESDCWDIERWRPFTHQSKVSDSMVSALSAPWSWLFSLRSLWRFLRRQQPLHFAPVSSNYVFGLLKDYDVLIGSGIAPAICARTNRHLDIFWPYAMGVEHLNAPQFVNKARKRGRLAKWVTRKVVTRQAEGIRKARHIFVSDLDMTAQALTSIDATFENVPIPAIYNNNTLGLANPSEQAAAIIREVADCDFSIMMHSRLLWSKPSEMSDAEWLQHDKNNDWVVRAFADLVAKYPKRRCRLILFKYGSDVLATQQLCDQLGLFDNVIWADTMPRREIMAILPHVTVGVGEIYENMRVLWGSTGWEILAAGRPLLQGFMFEDSDFEAEFGFPPPPMLKVREEKHVFEHLEWVLLNRADADCLGRDATLWFNQYNGIGLVQRWATIATQAPV